MMQRVSCISSCNFLNDKKLARCKEHLSVANQDTTRAHHALLQLELQLHKTQEIKPDAKKHLSVATPNATRSQPMSHLQLRLQLLKTQEN